MQKNQAMLAAICFMVFAIAIKFFPLAPNVACFGALAVFCGIYLRGVAAWLIPIGGIALSDILGDFFKIDGIFAYNGLSMILNYAGFAAMVGVGMLARKAHPIHQVIAGGLGGSLAFFFISNFGSWLDPMLQYERSVQGLVHCYVMAIPFFKNTIASDFIFCAIFIFTYRSVFAHKTAESNA